MGADVANAALATITAPTDGAVVNGNVEIIGSVPGRYTLLFGKGAQPDEWMFITEGQGPITEAVLGVWNTDILPTGVYTLRLEIAQAGKPLYSTHVQVRVERQPITIKLVQPAPDTRIMAGTLLPLVAEGSAGTQRIEFVVDGEVIGGTNRASATWNWLATARGQHVIEAVGYDANGNRVVSTPLAVLVE